MHSKIRMGEKPFKCHNCCKTFRSKRALHIHSFMHSKRPFKSQVCSKALAKYKRFKTHLAKDKAFECYSNGKDSQEEEEAGVKTRSLRPRAAKESTPSGRKISTDSEEPQKAPPSLPRNTTTKKIPYREKLKQCQLCSYTTLYSANLKRHSRVHTGEKPYKCHLCDKAFTQKGSLSCHVFNKHKATDSERDQKEPPSLELFQCQLCSYSTPYNFNLKKHSRVHTGEKPYKCHLCNKAFSQKGNLSFHILTQH